MYFNALFVLLLGQTHAESSFWIIIMKSPSLSLVTFSSWNPLYLILVEPLQPSLCLTVCMVYFFHPVTFNLGFPGASAGKESTYNAGDLGLIPGLGRSPGEGKGYPLQYSGLENSMDCIVHRVTKSWIQPSNFHFPFTLEDHVQLTAVSVKIWIISSKMYVRQGSHLKSENYLFIYWTQFFALPEGETYIQALPSSIHA